MTFYRRAVALLAEMCLLILALVPITLGGVALGHLSTQAPFESAAGFAGGVAFTLACIYLARQTGDKE